MAATHESVFAVPQRILSRALEVVMKTLKDFHYNEFKETKIGKFWIVKNSLDVVLTLPESLTDIYSSDIDSMYQNMDQTCVIRSISEEVTRAANIVYADGFFVVISNTCFGNTDDHCFWHNSESGLNPTDNSISSIKERCSKGVFIPFKASFDCSDFLSKILTLSWVLQCITKLTEFLREAIPVAIVRTLPVTIMRENGSRNFLFTDSNTPSLDLWKTLVWQMRHTSS